MIQLGLEYALAPPFDAGRPGLAEPAILAAYSQRMAPLVVTREAQAREAAARLSAFY
jgi:hypothetical protein